ncbi:MAG: hypothetical protein ACOYOH_28335 [Paracraurococcus sp.]
MALAGGLARDVDGQENTLKPAHSEKVAKRPLMDSPFAHSGADRV